MELVTAFRTFSAGEAQLIASRLEAAGLTTAVQHELAALGMDGYALAAGGILVQVPADQLEDARALIESGSADSQ